MTETSTQYITANKDITYHQESITVKLLNYTPPACQRPRLGKKGRAFSPSAEAEMSLAWMIRAQLSQQVNIPQLPFKKPCGVYIELLLANQPRGDIDNIAKFVLDSLQKAGVYSNDKLVHNLVVAYSFKKDDGPTHTVITVTQLELVPCPSL